MNLLERAVAESIASTLNKDGVPDIQSAELEGDTIFVVAGDHDSRTWVYFELSVKQRAV